MRPVSAMEVFDYRLNRTSDLLQRRDFDGVPSQYFIICCAFVQEMLIIQVDKWGIYCVSLIGRQLRRIVEISFLKILCLAIERLTDNEGVIILGIDTVVERRACKL